MTVLSVERNKAVDADLAAREAVIERGLRTFLDVGRELVVIREQRLYYQDFSSFEDYCQDRWQMDSRQANRSIEASSIAIALGSIDPTLAPTNLGQARELTGLTPETAAEVMTKAHETGAKVTAKAISEAREVVAPKPLTPDPAVTAYLAAGDQKGQDISYVRHFLKVYTNAVRVPTWDAERLGLILDEDEFASLQRHSKSLAIWVERVAKSRRNLRLIPGGTE